MQRMGYYSPHMYQTQLNKFLIHSPNIFLKNYKKCNYYRCILHKILNSPNIQLYIKCNQQMIDKSNNYWGIPYISDCCFHFHKIQFDIKHMNWNHSILNNQPLHLRKVDIYHYHQDKTKDEYIMYMYCYHHIGYRLSKYLSKAYIYFLNPNNIHLNNADTLMNLCTKDSSLKSYNKVGKNFHFHKNQPYNINMLLELDILSNWGWLYNIFCKFH